MDTSPDANRAAEVAQLRARQADLKARTAAVKRRVAEADETGDAAECAAACPSARDVWGATPRSDGACDTARSHTAGDHADADRAAHAANAEQSARVG